MGQYRLCNGCVVKGVYPNVEWAKSDEKNAMVGSIDGVHIHEFDLTWWYTPFNADLKDLCNCGKG